MSFIINRWVSAATHFEVVTTGGSPAVEDQVKGLPINKPGIRSIDAKTIAGRFNRGQPLQADYTWPGGRKFYQ